MSRVSDVAPDSVVRDQFQQAFAPDFNIASGFENPDQLVEDLQRDDLHGLRRRRRRGRATTPTPAPLDDRLSAIEVPLLVIFGAEDQIYDAEDAIEPYEDIPGVQTELIEGAGHSPNVETPEQIAPLIDAFIADRGRERASGGPRQARGAQASGAEGGAGRGPGEGEGEG